MRDLVNEYLEHTVPRGITTIFLPMFNTGECSFISSFEDYIQEMKLKEKHGVLKRAKETKQIEEVGECLWFLYHHVSNLCGSISHITKTSFLVSD